MSDANTVVMQEARIEELQRELNEARTAHALLLRQFEAVLSVAQQYVPKGTIADVVGVLSKDDPRPGARERISR